MTSLAQARESLNGTVWVESSRWRVVATLSRVPKTFPTLEVLEVAPTDNDFIGDSSVSETVCISLRGLAAVTASNMPNIDLS